MSDAGAPGPFRRLAGPLFVAASAAALWAHARSYDFLCDDALITLRYAKNLATLGAPVYNPGERVEGYTNFLWMLLAAIGFRLGGEPQTIVNVLGGLSALTLVTGVCLLWRCFAALPRRAVVFPVAAVALSAPVATWTLGGLETCLYAGLLAVSCALLATATSRFGKWPALAGIGFALATLTRPEGMLAFGIAGAVFFVASRRRPGVWAALGAFVCAYALIVIPHLLFRRIYYGDFLPNTYYLKSSGDPGQLRAGGLLYLRLFMRDFAVTAAWPGLFVLVLPARLLPGESRGAQALRRTTHLLLRLLVVAMIPHIVSVGGDFLGGYRFLVPLLPLTFVLACAGIAERLLVLEDRYPKLRKAWARPLAVGVASAGLVLYGSREMSESRARIEAGATWPNPHYRLEPVADTRILALQWAALGRWIHDHARPGDTMAGGAAGAAPYYAEIPNVDILGITDSHVARHGIVAGSRPGHQRHATLEYVLSRSPVFLFFTGAYLSPTPVRPQRDLAWERRGYEWVTATIDKEKHGAPKTYYFYFLMRKDRLSSLAGDPFSATAFPR